MNRFVVLFAIAFCFNTFLFAQKTVYYNNQQWLQYYNQLLVSKKFTLLSDVSLRRIHHLDYWSQITFRTGNGYPLSGQFNGASGFACFTFYYKDNFNKIEFRPYQEINSKQKFERFSLEHRLRAEFRYFRHVLDNKITTDESFNFRFRYRLFCSIPIINFAEKNPGRKILLNIGDEIFINAGRQITYNMFDNNRLLLGTAIQFNEDLIISFTYTNQFGQRNGPAFYENSDIIWIGIIHKLSLLKSSTD